MKFRAAELHRKPGVWGTRRFAGRTVFFLDVFVNNSRAHHVYKIFAFRKEGTMRDPSGCRAC
jgi:RimJ/RimL family protein N-acetyltransferase